MAKESKHWKSIVVFDDESPRVAKLAKKAGDALLFYGAMVFAMPSGGRTQAERAFLEGVADGKPIYELTTPWRRIGRPPGPQNKLPPGPRLTLFHWLRVAVCGGNHQERGSVGDGGRVTFHQGVPKFGGGIVERHPHKLEFSGEIR